MILESTAYEIENYSAALNVSVSDFEPGSNQVGLTYIDLLFLRAALDALIDR
jgi:hypothetical protein